MADNLLLLIVLAYVGVVAATVLATIGTFWKAPSFWSRRRFWIWGLMVAELIYMLQAPACVYLPRAPGRPAKQRYILGTDAQGRLYWFEWTIPMGFVWGPRWWAYLRGDVSIFPTSAGIEYVPPLRFARWYQSREDIVRSDGERWPYPEGLTGKSGWLPTAISADGTLFELHYEGARFLRPHGVRFDFASPRGLDSLGGLKGIAADSNGNVLEAFEPGNVGEIYERAERGERVLAFRCRKRPDDMVGPRTFSATFDVRLYGFGRETTGRGRTSMVQAVRDGFALFLTVDNGLGHLLRTTESQDSFNSVCGFSFDPRKLLSLAVTADLRLFSTGQAVWDRSGKKLREIDPPFESSAWVGNALHGVRPYPFFVEMILQRQHSILGFIGIRKSGYQGSDAASIADGARRSAWILSGIDESGREDEFVRMNVNQE